MAQGYRSYGPQPYRTDSVWSGVEQGYKLGNALRDDVAFNQAGGALARGDYQGGANALLTSGNLDAGLKVRQAGADADAKRLAGEQAKKAEVLKFTNEAAGRLAEIHRSSKDPVKTVAAFDQYFAPRFRELGEDEAEIAELRTGLSTDPETTLMALGAGAAKELGYDVRNAGDEVLVIDKGTGKLVTRYRGARTLNVPEGGALYELPGSGGDVGGDDGAPEAPAAPSPQPQAGDPAQNIRGIVDRLVNSGARITSAKRSPEDNARVGGAKNSYHLRGQAFDIVPPPGMSMDELAAELRSTGVDFAELINEGDHVHIAWNDAPRQPGAQRASDVPGGPRLVVSRPKAPKAQQQRLSAAEVEAAGYQPGSVVFRDPETGEETVKQGPGAGSGKITDGQRHTAALMYRVSGANDRLNGLAEKGIYKPESAIETLFNVDKNGAVRLVARTENDRLFMQAAREWLAPILRKDTGAAVTDEELRNYMTQFIPAFEDPPSVLWNKAQARETAMRALYGEASQAYDDQYGKPAQRRVLTDPRGKPGGAPQGGRAAPAQAVAMLKSDPSPDARREFDEVFGAGAAARALGGR